MAANIAADLKFQGKKHFGIGERQQLGSPLREKIQYELNYIARESMQGSDTTKEIAQYRFAGCRTAWFGRTAFFFFVTDRIFLVHICWARLLPPVTAAMGPHLPAVNQQIPRIGKK